MNLYHLSEISFTIAGAFYLRAFAFTRADSLSRPFAPGFGARKMHYALMKLISDERYYFSRIEVRLNGADSNAQRSAI